MIHQPVLLLKSVSTLPFVHIEPIVHCYEVNQPQSQKTNDPDDNSSEDTKSITNAVPQDGSLLLASYDGTVTLLALDELTVQEKNKKETVERMMTDSKKYKEQDKIEIVESHKIEDQNNKNSNQEQMKEKQEITDSTSKEGFKNLIELEKNEENLSDAATAVNETKMGSKLNDLIEDNKINQKDERRVAEEISQKQLEATSPTNETFQIPNEDSGPRKKRRIIPVRIDPVPSELPKKEETQIVEQKVRISMKPRLLNPHSLTFKKIRISVDSTSVQTTNSCVRKSKEFTGYFSPLCNCANKNTQTQQLKNQNTDESSDTIFLVTVSNADAFLYSFEVCNLSGLYFNEERLVLVHFLINEKNEFLRLLTVKDTLTGSTKIPPFTFSTLNVSLYRKTALLLGPTEFKVIGRKIWSGPVPEGNWNCRIIKRNISLRSFNCCQNTKKVNLTYNSKLGSFLIEQFNSLERIEKMIFEGVSARKVYKKIREYIKKGLNVEESKDKLKVERSNDLAEVSKRNTEEVKEEIETKRNTAEGLRGFISQRNRKDGNSTVDVRKEDRHNLPDKRLTIPQQTLYRLKPAILYVLTQQDTVTRLDMIYLLECEKDRLGEWFVDGVVRESRSSNGSP